MFLRTVKVKRPDGRVDEYIRLVESVWRHGRPEHRMVANVSRKDLLEPHADALRRMLKGEATTAPDTRRIAAVGAWDWRPVLVRGISGGTSGCSRRSMRWPTIAGSCPTGPWRWWQVGCAKPPARTGWRWLDTTYVCDRSGQRWWPAWRDEAECLASHRPRVRVNDRQVRQWYGTLDWLVRHKPQVEQALFLRLRTLFALTVDLVFYDLTSTYFEGLGPAALAKHGHSRDGQPRNRQVLLGVVMIDGWPIANHVFEENRRDASTVAEVLAHLQTRFGLRCVVFVGDRGMVTSPNVRSSGPGIRALRPGSADPGAQPGIRRSPSIVLQGFLSSDPGVERCLPSRRHRRLSHSSMGLRSSDRRPGRSEPRDSALNDLNGFGLRNA